MAIQEAPSLSEELEDAVHAARELARSEQRALSDHHVARVLCERPGVHALLSHLSVSVETVAAIARARALAPSRKRLTFSPDSTTSGYDNVMGDAVVYAYGAAVSELSAKHWLMIYLQASDAAAELQAAGLDEFALRWSLAHGPDTPRVLVMPASGPVTLRLHNDNTTSQKFVVDVLTEVVGYDTIEAHALMLKVDREGEASLRALPVERAQAIATAIYARAYASGFPLRLSVQPAVAQAEEAVEAMPKPQPGDDALCWEAAASAEPAWPRHELLWIAIALATALVVVLVSGSC